MEQKSVMVISAKEKDLGGFTVRRILPYASQCMVGPFIFFDHMGPAYFQPGQGIDVRPHPHINLATVTYLFHGRIRHQDSLGSDQLIEPGAINWMTAGHGIVHSERSPAEDRQTGCQIDGIQCWVALPEEFEEVAPSFKHYPAGILPSFELDGVNLKLLVGKAFQQESPVAVFSDLFYISVTMPKGSKLTLPASEQEAAAYVVTGQLEVNLAIVDQCHMAICQPQQAMQIEALKDSHLMLLGGKPLGKRYIYWNFVASSEAKIKKALLEWQNGPGNQGSRFPKIPNDDQEFIPLPEEVHGETPKGTIM